MRLLRLALVVALLAVSLAGLSALVADEPCSLTELAGQGGDDEGCPPTCVTCGCCVQAAEPVGVATAGVPGILSSHTLPVPPGVPPAVPLEILHVPRLSVA